MNPPKIAIVDYQLGNLFSVCMVCEKLGHPTVLATSSEQIEQADAIILPGVGAFGQGMKNLEKLDMVSPLKDHISAGKPLFGICLGMQLLFEESAEFGTPKGLGLIPGSVRKLPVEDVPIPQIGWNCISPSANYADGWTDTPLEEVTTDQLMYFVHSFYVDNSEPADAICRTTYGEFEYTSAVMRGSIFATQYHPEKSAAPGLTIYRHWIDSLTHSSSAI